MNPSEEELNDLRSDVRALCAENNQLEAEIARLRQSAAVMRKAVKVICNGFDDGVFVRSTSRDQNPKWAIELLPYIQALKELHEVSGA